MKRQDFNFDLPKELIAQYPLPNRTDSRLLTYRCQTAECGHHEFKSIVNFFESGDLLVLNNSKVIPARLYGHKETGGKVELLVERLTGENTFLAHIKAGKSLKPGSLIYLDNDWCIEIHDKQDDLYTCQVTANVLDMLHQIGHVPLPPYITRQDECSDLNRYQTIYAKHDGSVAAPTAGLHFDEAILTKLQEKGVRIGYTTLHVGAGTFQPVRCDDIKSHKMHHEQINISSELCEAVNATRAAGKRVIAVGTTALRSLESAAKSGQLQPFCGDTDIFIFPGYQFQICDALITNFHLPESTLLMLISAFIGYEQAMALYQTAISHQYRFFSYGDVSLLFRN